MKLRIYKEHRLIAKIESLEQLSEFKKQYPEEFKKINLSKLLRKSTPRQQSCVRYIEEVLSYIHSDFKFEGDINNFEDCFHFIQLYKDQADSILEDAAESYYSYINDKD